MASDSYLYEFPGETAIYKKRSVFYAVHKETAEPIERWLHRVTHLTDCCQFGTFRDFLLIDKFLCELDREDIEKLRSIGTVSLDEIFDAVVLNGIFQKDIFDDNCGADSNVTLTCIGSTVGPSGSVEEFTGMNITKIENVRRFDRLLKWR